MTTIQVEYRTTGVKDLTFALKNAKNVMLKEIASNLLSNVNLEIERAKPGKKSREKFGTISGIVDTGRLKNSFHIIFISFCYTLYHIFYM